MQSSILHYLQISWFRSSRLFSCEFCEIFKNTFFHRTSDDCFWWSGISANIRLDEDVLKTSWRRLSFSSSENVFKTSHQGEHIRLSHTFSRRLQDVLSRSLQDVFKTSCENVFKTSLRRLARISSRRFHVLSSS